MEDVTLATGENIAKLMARLNLAMDTGDSFVEQNKILWRLVIQQHHEIERLNAQLEHNKCHAACVEDCCSGVDCIDCEAQQ